MARPAPKTSASLVLLATLAAPAIAQGPGPAHAQGMVNDPRSHGLVGDNFLSLNEAILLNNGTLQVTQLSQAEQQQINGFGDIAFAAIDWFRVPKITLERDLEIIADTYHGFVISNTGGNRPTIDLNGYQGFRCVSNVLNDFRGLVIRNGQYGIAVVQDNNTYGTLIQDVQFAALSQFGVSCSAPTASGRTRIRIERCTFSNLPVGVQIDDLGKDRTGSIDLADDLWIGGNVGLVVNMGEGGRTDFDLFNLETRGTGLGCAILRPSPSASRQLVIDARHLAMTGGQLGLQLQGHPSAHDQVSLRMLDVDGTQAALDVGPLGGQATIKILDSRTAGDVRVLGGGNVSQITCENLRAKAGNWTLGTVGAGLTIAESIFDTVAMQTTGAAGIQIDGSRFLGGSAIGTSAASILIQGCHLGGLSLGQFVQASGSLPAAQLGSADLTPRQVGLGAAVTLKADLPQGLAGIWLLGQLAFYPTDVGAIRIYADYNTLLGIPAVVRLQQTLPLSIPNDPALLGTPPWFMQLAVVPDPGLQAPALSLPPGRFFVVQ